MLPYPHTRQDCAGCRERDADFIRHLGAAAHFRSVRLCVSCAALHGVTFAPIYDEGVTLTLSRVPDPVGDPLAFPHPPASGARPHRLRLPCTVCACHLAEVEMAGGLLCRWCLAMHLVSVVPSTEPVDVLVVWYMPEWHSPGSNETGEDR